MSPRATQTVAGNWQYVNLRGIVHAFMSPHKNRSTRQKKIITGIIQIARNGKGYIAWPEEASKEDARIENQDLLGALNGDLVEVALTKFSSPPQGKVLKVISRAKNEFVTTLKEIEGQWFAVPVDPRFYRTIHLIGVPENTTANSKALIRLISFSGSADPEGEIITLIGPVGEHYAEMNAIVLEHGFAIEFPEEVKKEARLIEEHHARTIAEETIHRRDYRQLSTLTIDPADAKDFDDALSVHELSHDEYEIGIHIADVTFFVRPKTALDTEARKRSTSVYLVDATIPMLPEELSGNVCSLRENEDRLTFSAVFRMNRQAKVLERRFEKSIIRSKKRFTYEEAQITLDTQQGLYFHELTVLRDLARILKKEREQMGAIDFGDANEVHFTLDEKGTPVSVKRVDRLETNTLIEEFMLLANREVAQYVSKLTQNIPEKSPLFLYRIHDTPKEDRIEELATFVRAIGYDFGNKKRNHSPRDIIKLLKDIEGTAEENLIRTATVRSMAKAIYSTKNIGHFGLMLRHYTHFTSPIRRYPDILVHRILLSHLNHKLLTQEEFSNLEQLCIAASEQEARAVAAERESIRYKQVQYMTSKIGQEFDALISGVTDWGLYVEEKETSAEGLVRIRTLGNEYFNYVAKEYALVGEQSKKKYTLGDQVRVKLVATDPAARTLDFALII